MDRFKAANRASILGMVGNIFLFIIKVIVGFISNSQAMIADAFNSASDILSSIMTYIGNRVASKDADDDHNLGHGKAEYIYSMLISIVMFILGGKILIDSIVSIINPSKYVFTNWLVIVCIVTIIVKLSLYLYTRAIGKKYHNLLVEANSKDHRNDVFITLANLVAAICSLYGIYVILNGHLSAGGGFSGGAIIGAGLILFNNAFGFKKTKKIFTYNTFKWVSFISLISYASLKTYSFFTGANHIESYIPLGEPGAILSSGLILPLNICVGCVVACTMYTFFTMFRKGGM